jgi:glycosyltransferase involved in cell wall biosynthesis
LPLPLPKTLILIPAFNAGPELRDLLGQVGERHPREHVLVVDDGSTTTDYGDLRAAGWRVERRPHGGKGMALRAGFDVAGEDDYAWVITMDADGQHAPTDLPAFLEAIGSGDYDLLIGNRMGDTRTMPWLRRLVNRVSSWVLRRLTGAPVHDVQSGYRAIARTVLERVTLTTANFDTEIEQIIRAAQAGMRIGEVPIQTIYNDAPSAISKVRDFCRFWRVVIRLTLLSPRRPCSRERRPEALSRP